MCYTPSSTLASPTNKERIPATPLRTLLAAERSFTHPNTTPMSTAPTYDPIPTAATTAPVMTVIRGGYWTEVWRNYRQRKLAMAALAFVAFLCLVALFAPMIVGTKPIVCKYKGQLYFPCMGYYAWSWENPIFRKEQFIHHYPERLKELDPESWAIWPLVYQDPYWRVRADEWPGLDTVSFCSVVLRY